MAPCLSCFLVATVFALADGCPDVRLSGRACRGWAWLLLVPAVEGEADQGGWLGAAPGVDRQFAGGCLLRGLRVQVGHRDRLAERGGGDAAGHRARRGGGGQQPGGAAGGGPPRPTKADSWASLTTHPSPASYGVRSRLSSLP